MTTEELLLQAEAEMEEEQAEYTEAGPVCVIDPVTRTIQVPQEIMKAIGVESDENAERVRFLCPRIVGDNIDLADSVLRINFENAKGGLEERDYYIVNDAEVEGENITFTWKLCRMVTKYKGDVRFIFCAVSGSGDVEWNTTIASAKVLEGLEPDAAVEEDEEDTFRQLIGMLQDTTSKANYAIQNAITATTQANTARDEADAAAEEARTAVWNNKNLTDRHVGECITAEGTVEAHAVIWEIAGKTEQETTNGYQLFDASKLPTYSAGGATVTNNGDGSFKVSGSGVLSEIYNFYQDLDIKLLKTGQIKLIQGSETIPYARAQIIKSDKTISWIKLDRFNQTATITQEMLNDEGAIFRIRFFGENGSSIETGTIKPMLYQDGDGTWEPFTGGIPSPNPDYPQEIKAIGELQENGKYTVAVKSRGKNMIPYPYVNTTITVNGITFTDNGDGSITINGTAIENADFDISNKTKNRIKLNIGKKYTLSSNGTTEGVSVRVQSLDYVQTYINGKTLTALYEDYYSWIRVQSGTTVNNVTVKPQLEESERATDYKPYQKSIATIELDAPLYEGDRIYQKNGELWVHRENGVAVFDGSDDENWNFGEPSGFKNPFIFIENAIKNSKAFCRIFYTFSYSSSISTVWKENNIWISNSGNLNFATNKVSTMGEWRAWLSQNPLTAVYRLATPTEEKLPQESFYGLKSFDGITHIFTDGQLKPLLTIDTAKTPEGAYLLDGFCMAAKNSIQAEQTNNLLTRIQALETKALEV